MDTDEYRALLAKQAKGDRRRVRGAVRVRVDGIQFDSKAEAAFYADLLLLKRSGRLRDFEVHPKLTFCKGCTFTPDFKLIWADGREQWIDVKGAPPTDLCKFKIRLAKGLLGITVEIVRRTRNGWEGFS